MTSVSSSGSCPVLISLFSSSCCSLISTFVVSSSCSESWSSSWVSCAPFGGLWMMTSVSSSGPCPMLISLFSSSSCSLISAFVVSFSCSSSESWSSSLVSCVPLGNSWMLIFASARRPCPMLISLFPSSSSSLSESWSSRREMSTAPLSFKASPINGISIAPVCSCWVSMSLSVNLCISPCNSFSGNSKARQQVNDHFGFLRHSFT